MCLAYLIKTTWIHCSSLGCNSSSHKDLRVSSFFDRRGKHHKSLGCRAIGPRITYAFHSTSWCRFACVQTDCRTRFKGPSSSGRSSFFEVRVHVLPRCRNGFLFRISSSQIKFCSLCSLWIFFFPPATSYPPCWRKERKRILFRTSNWIKYKQHSHV